MSWSFTASPLPCECCKACAEHGAPLRLLSRPKDSRGLATPRKPVGVQLSDERPCSDWAKGVAAELHLSGRRLDDERDIALPDGFDRVERHLEGKFLTLESEPVLQDQEATDSLVEPQKILPVHHVFELLPDLLARRDFRAGFSPKCRENLVDLVGRRFGAGPETGEIDMLNEEQLARYPARLAEDRHDGLAFVEGHP